MMTNLDIKITNPNGLTPRLAAELVEEANNYECDITMSNETDGDCNLKSIMNVFGHISASSGDVVHLKFEGSDEEKAKKGFQSLVSSLRF